MKETFTRDEVIQIIDILLDCPDEMMDAINNEHTNLGPNELLEMAEEHQSL